MIYIKNATTTIKITSIDESIFSSRYFSRCMENTSCQDCCCNYGCPVDLEEADRILTYKDALESTTGISASEWFYDEIEKRAEFPSGKIVKTRVNNNKCVFHDNGSRGCYLHRLALENGFNPHLLKPMVCFLFPLTWDGSHLYVSEFLDELPCKGVGMPVYEAQCNELLTYLGDGFYKEMDTLKKQVSFQIRA
jgi:Fe-S-cluster containining protein